MPRSIKSASGGSTFVSPVTVRQGGLGTTNAADALLALNGISANQLGAPHGIAKLNSGGLPDSSLFAGLSLSESCVDGPAIILTGTSEDYFLTTYDSFQSYEVVALTGTVSRDKNVITYTAPSTMGEGGFTVNGRTITVMAVDGVTPLLVVPSVTSPVNGSELPGQTVVTTSSAFTIINGTDTHVSTDWQVSTSASFDTIAFSSLNDTINLTSWTVTGMLLGTQYYVRVRHKGLATGLSNWSTTVSFTTKTAAYPSIEVQKLVASDPLANDGFGASVALSGNGATAAIRIPSRTTGTVPWAVYVYTKVNGSWSQQAKITVSPGSALSFTADQTLSLSTDGNTLLLGSYPEVNGGAVYVYTRSGSTWSQQARLTPGIVGNYFGFSADLSGDGNTVIVGAYAEKLTVASQGAVYVYTRSGSTWSQQAKLVLAAPVINDQFGVSVSISSDGNTAAITKSGSYNDGNGTYYVGDLYIFTRSGSTWSQQAKLAGNTWYGAVCELSADGNTVVGKAWSSSSIYTFTRSAGVWTMRTTLALPSTYAGALSLSSDGLTMAVGRPTSTTTYTSQGACDIYTRSGSTWTLQSTLKHSDQMQEDRFGFDAELSSDGTTLLVGVPYKTVTASGQGAAYLFN